MDTPSVTSRSLHEMNTPAITEIVDSLFRLPMVCQAWQCHSRPAGGRGVPRAFCSYPLSGNVTFSSLTRTAWRMVGILIVSMAIVVLVGYQCHTAAHDPMQASPAMHHSDCAFHITSHLCSLLATLPRRHASVVLALYTLYALALSLPLQGFVFPPFIPPKAMLRMHA